MGCQGSKSGVKWPKRKRSEESEIPDEVFEHENWVVVWVFDENL